MKIFMMPLIVIIMSSALGKLTLNLYCMKYVSCVICINKLTQLAVPLLLH